jgi:aspartate racemase
MWLFAQLEPDSSLYHQIRVIRWSGPVDLPALERSFSTLVRRHEVLRARFSFDEGGAYQTVGEELPLTIPVQDVRRSAGETQEAAAIRDALAVVARPFDLQQGPLVRAVLLRLGPAEHHLVLVLHHLATDGWSARLLLRELCALYTAEVTGAPARLAETTNRFADYVVRQQEWLQTPAAQTDLSYWREQLRGAAPLMELPLDRARPPEAAYQGAQVTFHLPTPTVERLRLLGRSERVTVFMILFAAFQATLSRWTASTDLVIGIPVAGRNLLEWEHVVGCFTNTLVLRTDLSGDPSFRELLRRVRAVVLEGLAHQEFPFERLVQELRPARSRNHHPLFQVLFNLLDFPPPELTVPGVEIEMVPVEELGRAYVDVSMAVERTRDGYAGVVGYDAGLFHRPTVERLTADYLAVLDTVWADPAMRLSRLPVASDATHAAEDDATARALALLERLSEDDVRRLLADAAGDRPS